MAFRLDRQSARIARSALISFVSFACLVGAHRSSRAQSRYQSTVQARPGDAPVEDPAADASVVTDDRTPRAGESVPQLIAELPGVAVQRTGGVGSLALISLRGSTWDQVGVYLDGVPLLGAQGGGVDLSTLPLGDLERIEVYRGASPIGFGSSALGGIVSLTTRAPRSSWLDAELSAGSFGTYTASASGAWAGRKARLYLGAHVVSSDGDFVFTSDDGTAFDTSHRHEVRRANNAMLGADGTARLVLPIDADRELSAMALVFFRDQGLPGYGSVRQTVETTLGTLRGIGSVAYESRRDLGPGSRLRAQAWFILERQRYHDPRGEVSISPADTDDRSSTLGLDLRLSRPFASWLRAAAVVEGRYQLFRPYDEERSPERGVPSTRLFLGAGLEADAWWRRARLHVIPSVRVEVAHDQRAGRDDFSAQLATQTPITNVVPAARLALVERATDGLTLRANVGRYSRLPSIPELYGNSGFLLGNPRLQPESGWNLDLGGRYRTERARVRLTIELAGFASLVEELIQFQQDAYGRARALNLGAARILGAEASVELRVGPWLRLSANATFTDGRNVSATSLGAREPLLPNRPRVHAYVRPEGRWPLSPDLALGAYVDLDVTDGNYLDPANLVRLPARLLVGAGLYAEAPRAHLSVIASAQNLGDARTFDFAGFPLPSRSFTVSARIHLPKESAP